MFWDIFKDTFRDENGVYETHQTADGRTHYSDGRSSYTDAVGNTHYSDGSVAYGTLRGEREHYNANGEYEKSSYKDSFGTTRYHR